MDTWGYLQDDDDGTYQAGSDVVAAITDDTNGSIGGSGAIPEPSSSILLFGGLLGLIIRRKR